MIRSSPITPLAFVVLAAVAPAAAAGAPDTLTDESIVRMVVEGRSDEEIVDAIRDSPVEFDLSQEMLDELRIAGVSERVLRAMAARHEELHPPQEPQPAAEDASAPHLRVALVARAGRDAEEGRTLEILDAVDPELSDGLRLRSTEQTIDDVAIVLLCRTPDHVPDQWRSQSPLGRDFVSAPRHRMLVFHAGAASHEVSKAKNSLSKLARVPGEWDSLPTLHRLELPIPPRLEATVEAGVEHDLVLGVAVRIAERYFLVAHDELGGVVVPADADLERRAVLRGRKNAPQATVVEFVED